jgi:hypothetical protein
VVQKAISSKQTMEDGVHCIQNGEFVGSVSRRKEIPFMALQERGEEGIFKPRRLLYRRAGNRNCRLCQEVG